MECGITLDVCVLPRYLNIANNFWFLCNCRAAKRWSSAVNHDLHHWVIRIFMNLRKNRYETILTRNRARQREISCIARTFFITDYNRAMIYILLLVFCFVFYPRTSPAPSIIRLTYNTIDSRQMGLVLRFEIALK